MIHEVLGEEQTFISNDSMKASCMLEYKKSFNMSSANSLLQQRRMKSNKTLEIEMNYEEK